MARTEYDYQFGHHDAILDRKLDQHLNSFNNPHRVTKVQVGLGKVENISPADMPLSNETKEYIDRFIKSLKIEQNIQKGIIYISALDANENVISKDKIVTVGAEGVIAQYDSDGNEIVSTYASEIVVKVEENQSYACLISPTGEEISRIPVCDAVSITEMVFDSETYTLKLIKSDGSEITCTLSSIYDNLIAYVDAEIKKVDDKLSEEVSRASAKESELKSAIDTEVERAKATENTKVDKIAYEAKIEELSQVDSGLAEDLEAEVTARENLKSDLDTFKGTVYTKTETENKIDEKIAAIDISDKLKEVKDEIEAEKARAEKAESDLQDNIDSLDEAKQDKLTAGDNITIENNVISATGVSEKYVDDKVEEYVNEKIPEIKKEFDEKIDAEAKARSEADTELSENKQDKIADLDTIREGAQLGKTAVQPDDLKDYVKTDDSRLSDARPASDVKDWAKAATKPTYTYSEVGAAAEDHNHDTEYSKLDHNHDDIYAAKEHTHPEYLTEEADPIFMASPAAGIKQEDIDKWNTGMTSVSWDDVLDHPTKLSDFEDDLGNAPTHTHDQYLEESDLDGYATEQWVEGKGYLTEHQDISGKADKADTYTKTETETKISEHHDSSKQDKIDEDHKLSADLIDGIIIPEVPVKSISVNGTNVPADEDKNVDISVPTKTSDLQKDDVYTKDETDSKCDDVLTEAKNYADSKIPEVTVKYELVPDQDQVEKELESGVRYMFTARNGLSKIDLILPSELPAGFITELTFRGDAFGIHESEDVVNILTDKDIKYTQFARTVTKPENSYNAWITYLIEYNGIFVTCYVTELQDSPTDR